MENELINLERKKMENKEREKEDLYINKRFFSMQRKESERRKKSRLFTRKYEKKWIKHKLYYICILFVLRCIYLVSVFNQLLDIELVQD